MPRIQFLCFDNSFPWSILLNLVFPLEDSSSALPRALPNFFCFPWQVRSLDFGSCACSALQHAPEFPSRFFPPACKHAGQPSIPVHNFRPLCHVQRSFFGLDGPCCLNWFRLPPRVRFLSQASVAIPRSGSRFAAPNPTLLRVDSGIAAWGALHSLTQLRQLLRPGQCCQRRI
jgi:hypothetical protein